MTPSERMLNLKNVINQKIGQRDLIHDSLMNNEDQFSTMYLEKLDIEQAQILIQTAAQTTQQQLEYHISELVTLALESVFPDPYKLRLVFETKRGKTEANIFFEDLAGNQIDPLSATGGGAVDIAAFALQVSLWSLCNPHTRSTLILDEPLKWLKGGDMPERGAKLIKEISDRLGIQIIMVSHSEELIESADNVIKIAKKNGVSHVCN